MAKLNFVLETLVVSGVSGGGGGGGGVNGQVFPKEKLLSFVGMT